MYYSTPLSSSLFSLFRACARGVAVYRGIIQRPCNFSIFCCFRFSPSLTCVRRASLGEASRRFTTGKLFRRARCYGNAHALLCQQAQKRRSPRSRRVRSLFLGEKHVYSSRIYSYGHRLSHAESSAEGARNGGIPNCTMVFLHGKRARVASRRCEQL